MSLSSASTHGYEYKRKLKNVAKYSREFDLVKNCQNGGSEKFTYRFLMIDVRRQRSLLNQSTYLKYINCKVKGSRYM